MFLIHFFGLCVKHLGHQSFFDSEVSRRNVHCLIERDDIQYKTFLDFLEFGSPGEVCSSFLLETGRHKKNSKTEPNFAGRKSKKDGARN